MATGLSLHLGLNSVDPAKYNGWDGRLVACENDARDMARLARAAGFADTTLFTADCTVENIVAELRKAAGQLVNGDILMFSYSGHGGQVPNTVGSDDEPDRLDETLVFYDRQFLDDELDREFARFADGVRILTLLDSCHSGSAIELPSDEQETPRLMPIDKQREIYERDKEYFQELQRELAARKGVAEEADALLISACQDNQFAADGRVNGKYTETLLKVWGDGAFQGGYRDFHRDILRRMPRDQSPNLYVSGRPDEEFLGQRPFTV
ncbi:MULTISPECIES: caspase family protein [Streptomyces]|uniref:Caspase family protein n=2 Tax=Streptomyces TaxID=1883 RepID=A0A646KUH6_STRJU|nr:MULTISPECIES: caspase family protein [Streptomyces]MQS39717.1 caspase family protein [Streptomyces katsurahamanus]MQT05511.1 caspase family protein [Streptomyces jumonjinensis]